MKPRIVAVGMLDHKIFKRDTFFVQINDYEVMLYEACTDGSVKPIVDTPAPLRFVTASLQKFNNMVATEAPVEIDSASELPKFIGKFVLMSNGTCRLVG
jgi:hypothetical protein